MVGYRQLLEVFGDPRNAYYIQYQLLVAGCKANLTTDPPLDLARAVAFCSTATVPYVRLSIDI